MTETPKCPYCGGEMALRVYEELKNKWRWSAWYICKECYSMGPLASECEEKSYAEEMALVYTLHRTEPEMRPLTLEEIIAELENKGWDVVWMECQALRDAVPMCPSHRRGDEAFFLAPYIRACTEALSNYSKTWRCWPRKPTPEQMAAEKWEE